MVAKKKSTKRPAKRPPSSGLEQIEAKISQLTRLAISMDDELKKLTKRVAALEYCETLRQMPGIARKSNEIQGGSRTFF